MVAVDSEGRTIGVERPLVPHQKIRIGDWEETKPGEWQSVKSPDEEAWIHGNKLSVQVTGTYGEGGYIEIPILVVQMLLEREGYRIKQPPAWPVRG